MSEISDVLQSGYYDFPLGYDSADWFVQEVIILENEINFFPKSTKKYNILTEKDYEDFKNNNIGFFKEV